ncbi:DUF4974 domain-containing protein [Maribellus luteus]|uniref:DUF4974 domain-containing protein n=1 Tax=Maribellus luteus TaxID=2305463 RepID=A0A399T8R6_9BACT|nr:FecR domain-containing protein [Maribellus luteus]RIJ50607.1 DUF4974 domain-containing protein [Maribellus luteus]
MEKNTHSIIIRLFSGEATPGEKRQVGEWLNQNNENRKLYTDLQEIWLSGGSYSEYNQQDAMEQFFGRIRKKKARIYRINELIKYAAIVMLLISLPVFYYLGKESLHSEDTYTTITCALGDKSTVVLPDSSLVYLNSGSKLVFNTNFRGESRSVWLEGEGYFSVTKNTGIPFIVKASDVTIEVLGTEFNLKAYPGEKEIVATLVEGSVNMAGKSQQIIMKPFQKVVYSTADSKMKLFSLNDITPETEWKEGRLAFRNESLAELELKLERWFDVDIEFADEEVKSRRFTGILERESILETISYFGTSKYVGYRIEDNKITFYSK